MPPLQWKLASQAYSSEQSTSPVQASPPIATLTQVRLAGLHVAPMSRHRPWHASPSLGSATQVPVAPLPTHRRPKSHSNSEVHTALAGLSATHMLLASQNAELTQSVCAHDSPIL